MPVGKHVSEFNKKQILELALAGLGAEEIHARIGLSISSVYKYANAAGHRFRKPAATSKDGLTRFCSGQAHRKYLPIENFNKRGSFEDGRPRYRSRCRTCEREATREHYLAHKARINDDSQKDGGSLARAAKNSVAVNSERCEAAYAE